MELRVKLVFDQLSAGPVRTLSDVQWAMGNASRPFTATKLPPRFLRGQREIDATVTLAAGWKRCSPKYYAWRPYKWNLSPSQGLGGPALDADEKQTLGIATNAFAMRIHNLIDWGERAHRGRAAKAPGLKKGDIVVSVGGKLDFASFEHLHAWVGVTMAAGQRVPIGVWRNGKVTTIDLSLPE